MSVVLATAGYDHKIRFWEAPSGVCIRIIRFADSQVNRLEITPDKQFIAAAGNPAIRLYEIEHNSNHPQQAQQQQQQANGSTNNNPEPPHQQAVLTLEGHTNNVTAIGFQKDGRYLYSCSEDGTIKVWDLRNPNYSRSFDVGAPVNSVCLRSDRDEFISGDQNGCVKVFDLGGSGGGGSSDGGGCINSVKPSALGSGSNSDRQINFPNNRGGIRKTPDRHHHRHREDRTRSNSASSAYSSISSRRYHHHQSSEGTVPIQAVDISEDSRTLVAVSNHGTVFVWDPSSNKPPMFNHDDGNDDGNNADHRPPPEPTAVLESSSWLRPITKFRAHSEKPGTYCLHGKIAPDCRHLVTTASDGTAKLWDTTTWELTQTLEATTAAADRQQQQAAVGVGRRLLRRLVATW